MNKSLMTMLCLTSVILGSGCNLENDRWPALLEREGADLASEEGGSDKRYPRSRKTEEKELPSSADEAKNEKPQPTPPSLDEIRKAVKHEIREEGGALLAPIVRQINDLNKRLSAVERQVVQLEGDAGGLRGETMNTLREFQARLDDLSRTVQSLHAEAAATNKALVASESRRKEERNQNEKLKAELASLTRTTQDLSRKVEDARKKVETERRTVQSSPRPTPSSPPTVQGSTRDVRLPCGALVRGLHIPPGGMYIRCPNCGQLVFLR